MMAVETALSFAWRHWKLFGWGLSVLAMGLLLVHAQSGARQFKKLSEERQRIIDEMKLAAAQQEAANKARVADAAQAYADRAAALQPIILRSKETVREYAQTPAGRAECLDAGIVRDLEALNGSLQDTGSAHGSAGTVPDPAAD